MILVCKEALTSDQSIIDIQTMPDRFLARLAQNRGKKVKVCLRIAPLCARGDLRTIERVFSLFLK
jgi:hypothetical protein